jgi:hypothetical protein
LSDLKIPSVLEELKENNIQEHQEEVKGDDDLNVDVCFTPHCQELLK